MWGIFAIISAIIDFIWNVWSFISKLYEWIKPFIDGVTAFINKWITPAILAINVWITAAKDFLYIIQGKVEQVINDIYQKVFPGLDQLRDTIEAVFNAAKDIAAVFNVELSAKIAATETSFLHTIDSYTRDLRDLLIQYVHDYSDPVIRKLEEIDALFRSFTQPVLDRLQNLENILASTFERPNVIQRDILRDSSLRWGQALWEDLFSGIVTPSPIPIRPQVEEIHLPDILEHAIQEMLKDDKGEWADAYKNSQEEIYEILTGTTLAERTKVEVAKLEKEIKRPVFFMGPLALEPGGYVVVDGEMKPIA
jgi:hypothetical protein